MSSQPILLIEQSVHSRLREVILNLYSVLVRAHLKCCVQLLEIPIKEDGDLLEQVFTEAHQDLKGAMRELERSFLQCHVLTGQGGMALKRKRAGLDKKKKNTLL